MKISKGDTAIPTKSKKKAFIGTNIPQSSTSYQELLICIREQKLTESLDLLTERGFCSELALFILAVVMDVEVVK